MPFFKKDKILFIHIPKTGGTSVEKYLSIRTKTNLGPSSLYMRYYQNTIQADIDKYRRLWKSKVVPDKKLLPPKKKGMFQSILYNEFDQPATDLECDDDESNDIFELNEFKRVRLVKELQHSLQHLTWLEMQQYKNILWDHENLRKIVSSDLYQRNDCEIITIVRNPYDRVVSDLIFNGIITDITIQCQETVYNKLKKYLEKDDTFDNHKLPQYMYITDDAGNLVENIIILRTETLTADMKHVGFADFNLNIQTARYNFVDKQKKYRSALNLPSIALINQYYKRDFELFGYSMLE